jgi:hypothetical protein
MSIKLVKISRIKSNAKNPRIINDEKYAKLLKSITEFPQMLEKRPLICFTDVDSKLVVLGGNMRLKASKELGLKELPVIIADDWTEEQKNEFIIKDNVGFGEWDWDDLNAEWDVEQLEEWGLHVPNWSAGVPENSMDDEDVDIMEEFDPIGTSKGQQRVVFIFDGPEEAESYFNQFPELPLKKMNMAWQINLTTTQSI